MPKASGKISASSIAASTGLTEAGLPSRVLVLTTYDLDRYVYDALAAGAAGFLLKATPPDRLVGGSRPQRLAALTEREREVLVLMARGRSNDDIAGDLVVAPATVKTHVNG